MQLNNNNNNNCNNSKLQQSQEQSNASSNQAIAAPSSIGRVQGGGGGGGGGCEQSKASEEIDMIHASTTPGIKGVGRNGYYARVLENHDYAGNGVLQLSKDSTVWIEHFAVDKNWSIVVDSSGSRGVLGWKY